MSSGGPLWRQLADRITEEIRSGHRPPGSKLPSVAEHGAAGLSQTTSMRAYRELVAQGLAVAVPGSGTYVADPLPDEATPRDAADHERRIAALEAKVAELASRLEQT